jgi:TRAP-type mannitol/chloroaromatic compound transport system permease large subunit
VIILIAALLASVAAGWLYAVEAAASGGLLLLGHAAASGALDRATIRHVLRDTMVLTGLLIALLVAATTFSLVVRCFETDVLIAKEPGTLSPHPAGMMAAVIALVLAFPQLTRWGRPVEVPAASAGQPGGDEAEQRLRELFDNPGGREVPGNAADSASAPMR